MDDVVEKKETGILNRDQVLTKVDDVLKVADAGERVEKTSEFVEDRLRQLTETTVPREFSVISPPRKGFLHPESPVRRNFLVDPFRVDDPEVYRLLIATFDEFRSSPDWQGKTLREIAPYAVLRTIGNYFGNHWGTEETEAANRRFYIDRLTADSDDIHLADLKGKGFAVCAEKAAVAQNLLSFLGYESELVASTSCRLVSQDEVDQSGHIYNVITSGENHLIFDPTNPIVVENNEGKVYTVMPAFYPIDQESYQRLMLGGQVEVTHNDGKWDGEKMVKGADTKRIYGGSSHKDS